MEIRALWVSFKELSWPEEDIDLSFLVKEDVGEHVLLMPEESVVIEALGLAEDIKSSNLRGLGVGVKGG